MTTDLAPAPQPPFNLLFVEDEVLLRYLLDQVEAVTVESILALSNFFIQCATQPGTDPEEAAYMDDARILLLLAPFRIFVGKVGLLASQASDADSVRRSVFPAIRLFSGFLLKHGLD